MDKFTQSAHDAAIKSQDKISALVEVITQLQQPLLSARQRNKDIVFSNIDEYEFLIDQLLGLAGSLSGDLSNAYHVIKHQSTANQIESRHVSKITSELWLLINAGIQEYRASSNLKIAR
jgi:hypothetical protein